MSDPLLALALAVVVPALSVLSAALARRWVEPKPAAPEPYQDQLLAIVARVQAENRELIDRRCERIALSQGKPKDAYKSWKASGPRQD